MCVCVCVYMCISVRVMYVRFHSRYNCKIILKSAHGAYHICLHIMYMYMYLPHTCTLTHAYGQSLSSASRLRTSYNVIIPLHQHPRLSLSLLLSFFLLVNRVNKKLLKPFSTWLRIVANEFIARASLEY